jgi:hypothetical protein
LSEEGDKPGRIITMQELRMRRASKKYEEAGLDTFLQSEQVRIEPGELPADVIQKMIDMYWRVQLASGVPPDGEDYVVTPIQQVIDNLHNIKEMFLLAQHFAELGVVPHSGDQTLSVSVKSPLESHFTPPPRAFPKMHVVENCSKCPMEFEGYCAHPQAEQGERLRDCDEYYNEPHPRCPLKSSPVLLRT